MKYLIAMLAILLLAAQGLFAALPAFAGHPLEDNWSDSPWVLTVIEWQPDGSAALSETFGQVDYATERLCQSRGEALVEYMNAYMPDMQALVSCIHLEGATMDAAIEQMILKFNPYFGVKAA